MNCLRQSAIYKPTTSKLLVFTAVSTEASGPQDVWICQLIVKETRTIQKRGYGVMKTSKKAAGRSKVEVQEPFAYYAAEHQSFIQGVFRVSQKTPMNV